MSAENAFASLAIFDQVQVRIEPIREEESPGWGKLEQRSDRFVLQTNASFTPVHFEEKWSFIPDDHWPYASNPHFILQRTAVSDMHSQISKQRLALEDRSLNGTYVNGQRVKEKTWLHDGDWIFAAGALFFVRNSILYAPPQAFSPGQGVSLCPLRTEEKPGQFSFHPNQEPVEFTIEAPVQDEEGSFESPPSPAGMMVISSLASVLSGYLMNPSDLKSIASSFAGASVTAVAFTLWYFLQGQKQKKRHSRKAASTMEDYLNYLDQLVLSIDECRKERTSLFQNECEQISRLDGQMRSCMQGEGWKIPLLFAFAPCSILKLPQVGWQMKNERAKLALEQIQKMEPKSPHWLFLEQGSCLSIQEDQIDDLFLLWVWMVYAGTRRFAWIGLKKPDEISHPASMWKDVPLAFSSTDEFLSFASGKPQIEWTICTKGPADLALFPPGSSLIDCSLSSSQIRTEEKTALRLSLSEAERRQKERKSRLIQDGGADSSARIPSCLMENAKPSAIPCTKVELAPGVSWDLDREGPHALIAGMTGSGKSEGLTSVLFQLALQNSPEQLQLVLIDFKGGSFGAPFFELPHTAAMMTNLQGSSIFRMEQALEMELARRQTRIGEYLRLHPDAEPSLSGCPDLKMSHVIICVDEFGQLRSRCPDFMKSLQETARIGRSLGFHLILSTQKPAGIVDEQIWANSRSRLCFSVLDSTDSREVLGHEKASTLKNPGEFILQVQSQSEKQGRAFYLKDPADGCGRAEILDEDGTWKALPRQTIQDVLRHQILDRHEKRSWILHPDPAGEADESSEMICDEIDHVIPFVTEYGSIAAAGSHQALVLFLQTLLAPSTRPVFSTFDYGGSCQQIDAASLYDPELDSLNAIVILDSPRSIEQERLEELLLLKNITLILVLEQVPFSMEDLLGRIEARIFLDLESREQKAMFFGGRILRNEQYPVCSAWISGQEKRLIAGQKMPSAAQGKQQLSLADCRMKIGKEQIECSEGPHFLGVILPGRRPVFTDEQALTFIASTPQGREAALSLAERLKLQDPFLTCTTSPAPGMLCLQIQEESDDGQMVSLIENALQIGRVIYFGPGLNTLSYALNLRLPYEQNGNAWLLDQSQISDLQSASLETQ